MEYRVRQVLEEKLTVIAKEFGVDKAADVMDSVEAEPWFDELFVHGLTDPASIDQECDAVLAQIREKVAESRKDSELLAGGPSETQKFSAEDARRWRDHPAQFWLERAITTGLPARGGEAVKEGASWRIRWLDGGQSAGACFDARTAEERPDLEWITLEDPRARALIAELPRSVAGQPIPPVRVTGLPDTVTGVWSLWEVSLSAEASIAKVAPGARSDSPSPILGEGWGGGTAMADSRKRFLPVFVNDEGRIFLPTARRIWDLLLTERIEILGATDAKAWWEPACGRQRHHVTGQSRRQAGSYTKGTDPWELSLAAAKSQGEQHIQELTELHRRRLHEARERARYAFDARYQAIGRIGLPAVRAYRRRRLEQEHSERMASLDAAQICLPDLNAIMMLRVGAELVGSSDSGTGQIGGAR